MQHNTAQPGDLPKKYPDIGSVFISVLNCLQVVLSERKLPTHINLKLLYIYTVHYNKVKLMINTYEWDELTAADEAANCAVSQIVMRHRHLGVLTWALLHQIEAEVLVELRASGEHSTSTLNMIRASPLLCYPKDDSPVSFGNASIVPVIFGQIEEAWNLVH
ncbi:DUF2471 family protein [Massilia aerilata]|uniref:DUF2471 family protein n=1 Tax=Massilia aerilata TaxID=453817 RepID=A0ABW0S429_9BURK